MRSYDPADEDDVMEAMKIRLVAWMQRAIERNPSYVHWGPYEDYMCGDKEGWSGRRIVKTWAEFGPWALDEYNECVNFYFYAERDSRQCEVCDGSGLNPATKRIADSFYRHSCPLGMMPWNDAITQDEVDALVRKGRLLDMISRFVPGEGWVRDEAKPMPTAAQVNAAQHGRGPGHDAINRWILIETRAKRLGVCGKCAECNGEGSNYTAEEARLGLVLWMIHPRKGASRGVDIQNIREEEMTLALEWLREASRRNAERFGKLG